MADCLGVAFGMFILGAVGGLVLAATFEASKEQSELERGITKLDGGLYFIGVPVDRQP